ncbi:MAG: hypothetical protein MjAS7_0473 [Metallosphaera javensis (ex Sakai et al. 2022)]|nr:MAG: hypothetical protein MjAS7_0473 [Metallosphaera javensis (ex Sakai et al. 2022)]
MAVTSMGESRAYDEDRPVGLTDTVSSSGGRRGTVLAGGTD